jgi:hypothetical protein
MMWVLHILLPLVAASFSEWSGVANLVYKNAGACFGVAPGYQACEGGWYSSPALTTLLSSAPVVGITATSSIYAFNAANGSVIWTMPTISGMLSLPSSLIHR